MTSVDFNTLMQNVTGLRITVEGLWGPEIEGIDNISLVSADNSTPVPEPASLLLVGIGLALVGVRARCSPGTTGPRRSPTAAGSAGTTPRSI
jgi:hypothetical protein